MIPELTLSAGAPRVAAVEHPFGAPLGAPGDAATQREVLRAALQAVESIGRPGQVVHLPFQWTSPEKHFEPPEPPPIARHLRLHIWDLPKFLNRTPPDPSA